MTPAITFTIPGEAVGKGRPRASSIGGQIRMHTPAKTSRYESLVALAAQQAMVGRLPIDGPVELDIVIETVPAISWPKKRRESALEGELRPTSKPDADNVLKAIADACNGIVFGDDRQIIDVRVRKFYAERAQTSVAVREWRP